MRLALLAAVLAAPLTSAQDEWNPIADYNAVIDRIPEGQRAWPLYAKASALLELHGVHDAIGKLPTDTPNWDELAQWLSTPEIEQVVSLYLQAAQRPNLGMCLSNQIPQELVDERDRLGLEPKSSPDLDSNPLVLDLDASHIRAVRSSTRLLCSHAILELQLGNPDVAVDRLTAAIVNASHASMPPLLVGQLVQDAAYVSVCEAIAYILSTECDLNDANLVSLQKQLSQINPSRTLDMRWEHFGVVQIIRTMYEPDGSLVADPTKHFGAGFFESSGMTREQLEQHESDPPNLIADLAYSLVHTRAVEQYSRIPPWERTFRFHPKGNIADLEGRLADSGPEKPPYPIVSAALQLNVVPILRSKLQTWAHINATLLTLTLHRHHLRCGAWPETLDAIDPDILAELPEQHRLDPFTGKPLLYKLTDAGPIVYSAGADRDDDHARQLLDADGNSKIPRWIPADQIEPILESDPASIDGDWILYPPN